MDLQEDRGRAVAIAGERAEGAAGDSASTEIAAMQIELRNLTLAYGDLLVLDDISVNVSPGQFVSIIGPSGCGKSTLLSVIAGLLAATSGSVLIGNEPIASPGPDRAVVFQNFALLPWKTVVENVSLALRYRSPDLGRSERDKLARNELTKVGLAGFEDYFPHQLSGGMQQRVGLARAFAVSAPILLMDEPFGAIDAQNAEILREDLRSLVADHNQTILFITHNLDEALFLSDRILLMSSGPGHIMEDVTIDVPHPRRMDELVGDDREQLARCRSKIWTHLREEVAKSAQAEAKR